MLARRRRRAAARPRVDRAPPASAPAALRLQPASVPERPAGTIALRVVWRKPCVRPPVVAANYDAWMHHRLTPAESGDDLDYFVTLFVPMGVQVHYKFLVDGKWRVDDAPGAQHELSSDGKVHVVPPMFKDQTDGRSGEENSGASEELALRRPGNSIVHSTLPQTSSASVLPRRQGPTGASRDGNCEDLTDSNSPLRKLFTRGESFSGPLPSEVSSTESIFSLPGSRRGVPDETVGRSHHDIQTLGYGVAARRSVLMRIGGQRWRARLGLQNDTRPSTDATESEPSGTPPSKHRQGARHRTPSLRPAQVEPMSEDIAKCLGSSALDDEPAIVSSSVFFAPSENVEPSKGLTNSALEKENSSLQNKAEKNSKCRDSVKLRQSPIGTKRHHTRRAVFVSPGKPSPLSTGHIPQAQANALGASRGRGTLRSSTRGLQKVTVSAPTRVDEPQDHDEVHRTAHNWRAMAQHLQEDLNDPVGARRLLHQAIEHREKHGLWSTFENAQVHVDLARSLSKASLLSDAEFHLRIALRIYEQVGAASEHKGDLVHYIAVVVDRQKKRADAEQLYKQALDIYKAEDVTGDNVSIALKNLALNLKKQNRASEADVYIQEYCANEAEPSWRQATTAAS